MSLQQKVECFFRRRVEAGDWPGFQMREGQLTMAKAVASAIEEKRHLIVEAGTGTGKTLAYLVPALLSGKRILVSTATKALQDQLINKDLPRLCEVMSEPGEWMQLKGRENYVCQQRLALAETGAQLSSQQRHQLAEIRSWLAHGGSGERGDCPAVEEQARIWPLITAKAEFCQQVECGGEGACLYPKLKARAQQARLLVVNHHLLASDLALRMQGAPGILPDRDIYIMDEAHQLADVVQQFLGTQIGSAQLLRLQDAVVLACEAEAPEACVACSRRRQALSDALSDLTRSMMPGRYPLNEVREQLTPFFDRLIVLLSEQLTWLEAVAVRGKGLAAAKDELESLIEALNVWWQADQDYQVCWCELGEGWFRFYQTPLRVDQTFSAWVAQQGDSWIFTSATLTDSQGFGYFQRRLGLTEVDTCQVDSPFDYGRQGLIYHPAGLPMPQDPDYVRLCLRRAWPLLKAAGGHALLLFSSYRALRQARELLADHWHGTLLVQGEAPRQTLMSQFRTRPRAVLLATASFWEGVDLPGDQLRLVMIDKIPFAPPDDPVLQAESARLSEQGKSPFALLQLPVATLALKQGAGRLIRTELDRGVLMLCDPRLTQKTYGASIMRQLPPFRWTRSQREAVSFLKASFDEVEKP